MYKKIVLGLVFTFLLFFQVWGAEMGSEICDSGLPGCETDITTDEGFFSFLGNIISQIILYVAVLSVISVTGSGIMYMLSMGEDGKTTKAKKWIIWSLVGLVLSVSAWSLVNLVNSLTIK